MKLLVTGREGQVVRSLLERAATHGDVDVVAMGRPTLDLARPDTIEDAIATVDADVVVSAAAYTAVDQAEDEPELAHRINAEGAGALAAAAFKRNLPIIHISTDYVFSGGNNDAYAEADATGPTGAYGASKLAGEAAVAAANPRHVILRTAWVYSPFGKNFVKTMLRLAGEREELTIVGDQFGNPTSAFLIADGILRVAENLCRDAPPAPTGLFHLVAAGDTNWSGFAEAIMAESRARGGPAAKVRAITTADFPTKARRPANSRLSTRKLAEAHGFKTSSWKNDLGPIVERILREA